MKTFWAALIILALAAGGFLYTKRMAAQAQVAQAQAARTQAEAAQRQAEAARQAAATTPAAKPETPTPEAPTPKPAPPAEAPKPEAPTSETPTPEAPKTEAPKPEAPKPAGGLATDPASAGAGVVLVALTGVDGKPLSLRAGVLLAADLVATPAHLLDQAISGAVTTAGGAITPIGGSVVLDQARDLAILKLVSPITAPTVLKPVAAEAATDRPVFVVPGDAPALQASLVGYRTDTVQGRRVQIRGDLPANAVGMPVVNDAGEMVGLITGKDASGAALVLAASEITSVPRGKITPLTATAMPAKKDKSAPSAAAPPDKAPPGTPAGEVKPEVASEAKIEKKPDGTLLVDDKYVVKGEGTKDKPYEITWEMLTSVQDDYDPRKGKKKVPGRVMMLDGKWVKVTGNVAFPMYVDQPKELLSMLNQWDGCCIGVPPTPYDAIEVRLTAVVGKDDRLATFGVVTGKMSIKPYLVGDWLVGLYIMDDAALSTKQYGGFGS